MCTAGFNPSSRRQLPVRQALDAHTSTLHILYYCHKGKISFGPGMCLKIHSYPLHAPRCGKFDPHSVNVAHYASLIWTQFPTNCDAHLTESNFQTRSGTLASSYHRIARKRSGISEYFRCFAVCTFHTSHFIMYRNC